MREAFFLARQTLEKANRSIITAAFGEGNCVMQRELRVSARICISDIKVGHCILETSARVIRQGDCASIVSRKHTRIGPRCVSGSNNTFQLWSRVRR